MGIEYKVVIVGKLDAVGYGRVKVNTVDIVAWLKEMYEAKIENVKITIEANTGEGEDCE